MKTLEQKKINLYEDTEGLNSYLTKNETAIIIDRVSFINDFLKRNTWLDLCCGKGINSLLLKIKENSSDYYLSKEDIKKMSDMNMIIGSHTHSHCLLSKLNYKNQEIEIKKSKSILEKIIKKRLKFFCYPHGGKDSYNNNTVRILKKYM